MPCVKQSKQIKTWDYDRMYTACSSLKCSFMWKKIISFNIEKLQEIQQAKQAFAGKCSQRLLQLHSWELLEATTLHLISFTADIIWLCIPQEVVPTLK